MIVKQKLTLSYGNETLQLDEGDAVPNDIPHTLITKLKGDGLVGRAPKRIKQKPSDRKEDK